MFPQDRNIIRALAIPLMLFLFSCASYNRQITTYYTLVEKKEYQKASTTLEKIKLLNTKRNRLLYLLEKGKMSHLMKDYDQSNVYFNEADRHIEDVRTSISDIALGTLLNPMMQTYKGEDFEKFMVHYYKSLNYMYLGQSSDAIVEAKRISLRSFAQQDKASDKKYSDDAFALMLQGIIYESAGDINNAFISYRNAVQIYLNHQGEYYGVKMPEQLKTDLLRTAHKLGFYSDLEYYENQFSIKYTASETSDGGDLVLFWENGFAPVKREQNFFFSLTKDGAGNFMFIDEANGLNVPFDFSSGVNRSALKPADLRSFRVAFPKYEEQPIAFNNASIYVDEKSYRFERAEDINALAFATLKERFVKEISIALSRLVVKKLAEEAARPKDEDDKKKKEREAMALALQIFSFASEKADTRNWQTLPHTIHYSRIPLRKGKNIVKVEYSGPFSHSVNLEVEGLGHLQLRNLVTMR